MKTKKHSSHYGPYGGRYVPEMLLPALTELEEAFSRFHREKSFQQELAELLADYAGRPTPLYLAANLTRLAGGAEIFLKLEGLAHTGAHKINNVLGQTLLAVRMGKKQIIAETGAGQHGLATAAAAARFGLECRIFMGETDMARQYPNVFFMRRMGAEVIPVTDGGRTLKDAVNAALKYWMENLADTHYLLGSALGPHPYPTMVRTFQSVIGREVKKQLVKKRGRQADAMVACVGGGSNALGLFSPFLNQPGIRLIGVEAGGLGLQPGRHASRANGLGQAGIIQGYKSLFLQDVNGQVLPTHSISAGLDYAGIGPQLAELHDRKRIEFKTIDDREALAGFKELCRCEGIIPALESAHAVAQGLKTAAELPPDNIVVINVSGRGEKDLFITAAALEEDEWRTFLHRELHHEKQD